MHMEKVKKNIPQGERCRLYFILLHMDIQFLQHHLWNVYVSCLIVKKSVAHSLTLSVSQELTGDSVRQFTHEAIA